MQSETCLSAENLLSLRGRHFSPCAGREVSEFEFTDGHSEQPQSGMTDRGSHASDLAIFSFRQTQFEPYVGNVFAETDRRVTRRNFGLRVENASAARSGFVILQRNSAF